MPQEESPEELQPLEVSASDLVHNFLTEHNIKPKLVVVDDVNIWDGTGHLLNDKPLLKVTYEYTA